MAQGKGDMRFSCVVTVCVLVCGPGTLIAPGSAQTLTSGTNATTNTQPSSLLLSALRQNAHPVPSTTSSSSSSPKLRQERGGSESTVENRANYLEKKASDIKICRNITTSDHFWGLQGVAKTESTSASFFVRPLASFHRLVLRMRLGHRLDFTDIFLVEKEIEVTLSDLLDLTEGQDEMPSSESASGAGENTRQSEPTSEGDEAWFKISVEHFERLASKQHQHSLNVTFGNTNGKEIHTALNTDYRWLLYDYMGFAVYAEGGANFLFYCEPMVPEVGPRTGRTTSSSVEGGRPTGVWLLVGLLAVAALLLTVLLASWIALRHRNKRRVVNHEESVGSQVYEEFDEEVLRSIQKKVETLRNGKGDTGKDDVCVVTYYPNQTKTNSNYSQGSIGIIGHPQGDLSTASTDRYVDPKTLFKYPQRTGIADGMGENEENIYEDPATLPGKRVKGEVTGVVHDVRTIYATLHRKANPHSQFQFPPYAEDDGEQDHLYEDPKSLLKKQPRKEGLIRKSGVIAAPKHHSRVPHNQFNSQPLTESADGMEDGLYDEDDEVFYEDPYTYQEKQLREEEEEEEGTKAREDHYQNISSIRPHHN